MDALNEGPPTPYRRRTDRLTMFLWGATAMFLLSVAWIGGMVFEGNRREQELRQQIPGLIAVALEEYDALHSKRLETRLSSYYVSREAWDRDRASVDARLQNADLRITRMDAQLLVAERRRGR